MCHWITEWIISVKGWEVDQGRDDTELQLDFFAVHNSSGKFLGWILV